MEDISSMHRNQEQELTPWNTPEHVESKQLANIGRG